MARKRIPLGMTGYCDRNIKIRTHTTTLQFFDSKDRDNGTMDEWVNNNNTDNGEWVCLNFLDGSCFMHYGDVYSITVKDMENIVVQMRMIALVHRQMEPISPNDKVYTVEKSRADNNATKQNILHSVISKATTHIASTCAIASFRGQRSYSLRDSHNVSLADGAEEQSLTGQTIEAITKDKQRITVTVRIRGDTVEAGKESIGEQRQPSHLTSNASLQPSALACNTSLIGSSNQLSPKLPARCEITLQDVESGDFPMSGYCVDHVKSDLSQSLVGRKIQVRWTYHKCFHQRDMDLWCTGDILSMTSYNSPKKARIALGYVSRNDVWYAKIMFQPRLSFEEPTTSTILLDLRKWTVMDMAAPQSWRLLKDSPVQSVRTNHIPRRTVCLDVEYAQTQTIVATSTTPIISSNQLTPVQPARQEISLHDIEVGDLPMSGHCVDPVLPDLSVSLVGSKIQVGWTYNKCFHMNDMDLWCTGDIVSMTSRKISKRTRTALGCVKTKTIWYAKILFQPRLAYEEPHTATILLDLRKWTAMDNAAHHFWQLLKD